ncbi:MAG TPA: amidohydrolase, partial [Herpetosiphonaceae bacterium]
RGYGWNHTLWGDRWPTAAELDQVTGGRPAVLSRKDAHSVWCNSAALALAGITDGTADPAGGQVQRDAAGRATGVLLETAQGLIWPVVAGPDEAQAELAIERLLADCRRAGLTSVHVPDPAICLRAVQSLYNRGALGMRVLHHLRIEQLEPALAAGIQSGLGDHWLRIGGVKIFSDGTLGSCTAHMLEPFEGMQPGTPHCCGMPTLPNDDLAATIERAVAGRLSVAVHAIGDAANRAVLDSIEAALRAHPEPLRADQPPAPEGWPASPTLPHRIEHAQLLHPDDLPRFARLGVVASMQPIHATSDMDIAERLWGRRCASAYAWRTLLDLGATLAFGSDAPIESWNPWLGIHAAVTRQRQDDTPPGGWHPELRLTLEEALWAYTAGPALASGELADKGTLAAGKLADIAVLDRDLADTAAEALRDVTTDATVLGGNVVWERV